MKELVKKSILFGLGTYQISKEKLEEFVNKMQKEEKLTPEEGKKVVEEVMDKASKEAKEYKGKLQDAVRDALKDMGVATKDDIDALKKSLKK